MKVTLDESARIRFHPIMPYAIVPLQISIRESSTEPKGRQVSRRLVNNLIPAERRQVEKGCPSRKGFGDVPDKGRGRRAEQHKSAVTGPGPVNDASQDREELWKMLRLVKDETVPELRQTRFRIRCKRNGIRGPLKIQMDPIREGLTDKRRLSTLPGAQDRHGRECTKKSPKRFNVTSLDHTCIIEVSLLFCKNE
jgi:hypothetical protein